jgi:hypothetical protein
MNDTRVDGAKMPDSAANGPEFIWLQEANGRLKWLPGGDHQCTETLLRQAVFGKVLD